MRKGEETRNEFLQIAERLFCAQGYEETSIQNILDAAHGSKGGFYHHFVSKEDVLRQLCERRAASSAERTAQEIADGQPAPLDQLSLVLGRAMPIHREDLSFMCMMMPILDRKEGMTVRIIRLNTIGTVVSLPNSKGNLYVTCGSLSTQVNISDLEIVPEEPKSNKPGKSSASKIKAGKSLSVSAEINLIGMTKDEAIMALDKYLDDAYIAHISPVRIVHGKGSGILREAVAQKLRRTKTVKSYRLGEYGEGDSGVTIAEFN